jgi:hypothetical protein
MNQISSGVGNPTFDATVTAVSTLETESIGRFILVLRRQCVLLDEDLATLYGVETCALVQAVKRNVGRFPPELMFQLTGAEWAALRSQTATSKAGRGGRRSYFAGTSLIPGLRAVRKRH